MIRYEVKINSTKKDELNKIINFFYPNYKFEVIKFYKRPYSDLYEVRIRSGNHQKNIFIKRYKSKDNSQQSLLNLQNQIINEYNIGNMLDKIIERYPEYNIIKPIKYSLEYLSSVTEKTSGIPLGSIIEKELKLFPTTQKLNRIKKLCFKCGKLIKIIQKHTLKMDKFDPRALIDYIEPRLKRLSNSIPIFKEYLSQDILRYFERQIPNINNSDLKIAGVHGDFDPFNILIENEAIKLLDFADFHYESIYRDVTYFYQRLESFLHKPIFRPKIIYTLQEVFCRGYNSNLDKSKPIFILFRIIHVINNMNSIVHLKTVPNGKKLPFYKKIFNKQILNLYIRWLSEICN